ncbi:MAG: hypothetical protein H6923_01775 [Alphaproteobacteria bacterium]|nr:hypothetical protein [Alphaproteobacteria bacterium]
MAHFKRRRSKRVVRCTLCTPHRWMGNAKGRFDEREPAARAHIAREARDADERRQPSPDRPCLAGPKERR